MDSSKPCYICHRTTPMFHIHHVVPQARGGEHGLTIILCDTCHNYSHKVALARLTVARGGKTKSKDTWAWNRHPLEVDNAEKIIRAICFELTKDSGNYNKKVMFELTPDESKALNLLKLDMCLSSREKTIKAVLIGILKLKGFLY